MDLKDVINVGTPLAELGLKLVGFVSDAIKAAKDGDDSRALANLDAAVDLYRDGSSAADLALDQIEARGRTRVKEKFEISPHKVNEMPAEILAPGDAEKTALREEIARLRAERDALKLHLDAVNAVDAANKTTPP
jgi:hypothetical protein